MKKIHFIAIGGSAMHNLAIELFKKGYKVSGSDDNIFEPSFSNLKKYQHHILILHLKLKPDWDVNFLELSQRFYL